jgi:hypothetical protein
MLVSTMEYYGGNLNTLMPVPGCRVHVVIANRPCWHERDKKKTGSVDIREPNTTMKFGGLKKFRGPA